MHSEALCCLLRLLETYIEEIIKTDFGENRRCGLIAGGSRRIDRVTGSDIVSGLFDSQSIQFACRAQLFYAEQKDSPAGARPCIPGRGVSVNEVDRKQDLVASDRSDNIIAPVHRLIRFP